MNVSIAEQIQPLVTEGPHRGRQIDKVKGYRIIACETCGFHHMLPLPTKAELASAYSENYYKDQKPNFIKQAREDAEWSRLAWNDRLALFEEHLKNEPKPYSVLDIGCGPGWFLHAAKARGWQTRGVEPSVQASEHARELGLDVLQVMFDEDVASCMTPAHVVHLNNMLEHVADPIGLLQLAIQVTRPGGLLCVGVPNDYNAFQATARAKGMDPWWLVPPHHINYFNFDSLEDLLKRLGLEIVEATTSFPMELFLLMGDNYVGNDTMGRAVHERRKCFDMAFETAGLGDVRRRVYRALAKAGVGREAVVVARKTTNI